LEQLAAQSADVSAVGAERIHAVARVRKVVRTPCVNFVGGGAPNKGINPTRLSPLVSAARRAFRLVSVDKYHAATVARVMRDR
jgi:hypothetical protein